MNSGVKENRFIDPKFYLTAHLMKPGDPGDILVDRKFAGTFLGGTKPYTPETLAVWDCTKRYDLRPVKMGRCVRYWLSHLVRLRKNGLKPIEA